MIATKSKFQPSGKPVRSVMLVKPAELLNGTPPTPVYLFVISRPTEQTDDDLHVKFEIVDRQNRVVESAVVEAVGKAMDYCDAYARKNNLEQLDFGK